MVVTDADLVRAGSLDELKQKGCLVVGVGGHTIAVFWHEDRPWAVDNRCPHMGFPLSRGTVCEGLLTCHWHNARFDLASGGTLDPFADDVRAFPAIVQDGQVLVDVSPEGATAPPTGASVSKRGSKTTSRSSSPRRPWPCSRAAPIRARSSGSAHATAPATAPGAGARA